MIKLILSFKKISFFLLFLVWCLPSAFLDAFEVPELKAPVTDLVGLLSEKTNLELTQALITEEQRSSNQVAVLIVPDLQGEDIASVAIQVFDKWQLGQKSKNNGILLLIALSDKKMRIEVGRGLEGSLPDVVAYRIIKNSMKPKFKIGEFDEGVKLGIADILASIDGSYTPSPKDTNTWKPKESSKLKGNTIFFAIALGLLFSWLAGKGDGCLRFVFLFLGFFFLAPVFFQFASTLISLAMTAVLQMVSFLFGRNSSWGTGYSSGGYWIGGGGWSDGGSWGSGSDSSWSGGGGDSGGGGASGDW